MKGAVPIYKTYPKANSERNNNGCGSNMMD